MVDQLHLSIPIIKGRVEYSMSSSHFNIKLRKMIKCGYKLVASMGRMFMVESSAIFL